MDNKVAYLKSFFGIPEESYVRIVTTGMDVVEFFYLNGYSTIEDGWFAWSELINSHSYNGIDICYYNRHDLEKRYRESKRLNKITATLEPCGDYRATYIKPLNIIVIKND